MLPFEYTQMRCPIGYEKILETMYGDWRTPVRGIEIHSMYAVDPDLPYLQAKGGESLD